MICQIILFFWFTIIYLLLIKMNYRVSVSFDGDTKFSITFYSEEDCVKSLSI